MRTKQKPIRKPKAWGPQVELQTAMGALRNYAGRITLTPRAEVAELVYAQDLGSCGRKAVWVRLPPSAPKFP